MMEENELKIPKIVDAEERVLAHCLADGSSDFYDSIAHKINSEDFYLYRHNLVFQSVSSLAKKGEPLNEISLVEELKRSSTFDDVDGMTMITTLMEKHTSTLDANNCANVVKEKSNLRKMIKTFKVALEKAEDESEETETIRGVVEGSLLNLETSTGFDMTIDTAIDEIQEKFEQQLSGEWKDDVVKTHIPHLDDKLGNGGIGAGEVVVISAPTSCGKSQLALNIVARSAFKDNVGCGIFSLEMPRRQVLERLITAKSQANLRQIKDRVIDEERMEKVRKGCESLKGMPIYTVHSIKNIGELCSHARTMVRRHKVKLLVIDYLQLIPFNSKNQSKNDAVANISHTIKQLALELDVGILLLSQVNREGARREGGLAIYDLKDSGDIENDADVIILMWAENGDIEESKRLDGLGSYISMKYNVAKNREGERDVKGKFKFYTSRGIFT
jgi:replicative DNA helicase